MISRAVTSPYITYLGSGVCNCMEFLRYKAISLVAQSIYHDFEESLDRKLQAGDLSPEVGWCEGHPGASHGKRISMDVNYYTNKSNFSTQYFSQDFPRGKLWDTPGVKLIPGIFDWERNFLFAARLCQIMPKTSYTINSVLMKDILVNATNKYGTVPASVPKFSESDGATYNHHTHAHIDLAEVDPDFRVTQFIKRRVI